MMRLENHRGKPLNAVSGEERNDFTRYAAEGTATYRDHLRGIAELCQTLGDEEQSKQWMREADMVDVQYRVFMEQWNLRQGKRGDIPTLAQGRKSV